MKKTNPLRSVTRSLPPKGERIAIPQLLIAHRQRALHYNRRRLECLVHAALPLCIKVACNLKGPLASLPFVEISIVGKRTMASLHREFLNIPGATDVITFPYGEIIVCGAVARTRARDFGTSVTDELALYIIHGLLHLAGHDDKEPPAAKRMAHEQKRILQAASIKLC